MARQHGKYLPYQFLPEIDLEMHAASPSGTNARHITQEFEERIRTEGATPPVRSKKEAIETVVVLGCAGSRNNESGGPRRCISRPHPMKTRRYHASPHRPTFARISHSYAVCRRWPPHHHFKIPTHSPVGIFCLLPRVHGGWRGFLRTSPKDIVAVFGPVFSLRWLALSVPAPPKTGEVLKRKI